MLSPLSLSQVFELPRLHRVIAAAALSVMLAACATRAPAPIEDRGIYPTRPSPPPIMVPAPEPPPPAPEVEHRPPTYTVKRGDTLYAIALDNGLDYRELAAWNNIDNINLIRVGQVLRLSPPDPNAPDAIAAGPGVTTTPLRSAPPVVAGDGKASQASVPRNTDNYKSQPKAVKEPYSENALRELQRHAAAAPASAAVVAPPAEPAPPPPVVARAAEPKSEVKSESRGASQPSDDDAKIQWLWPTEGKVITGFSDTENLKGIDIAGKTGQPIVAAAAGKVVYAGTGLRGYGKLIIVKHNNSFLSAYAHNKDILVKEGQQVTRGQKIAEMGNTDSDQVKLHFEIRRLGKPIDPLKYLPPA
jgi:lipoprotein NlpD